MSLGWCLPQSHDAILWQKFIFDQKASSFSSAFGGYLFLPNGHYKTEGINRFTIHEEAFFFTSYNTVG